MAKKPPLRKDGSPSNLGAHFRNPAFQREMRSRVSSESCSANGKKGFLATAKKYGRDFALRFAAAWRRSKGLNVLEQIVAAWLDEFQVHYERDVQIGCYFADFLLCDLSLVVKVDGAVWHTNHPLHGEDRISRDQRKDRALRRRGYQVVRLSEVDIRSGDAKQQLDEAIHRRLFRRHRR